MDNMMGMVRLGQMPGPADPAAMAPPAMPDEDAILGMLMQAVMGRWAQQDAQLAGEKGVLTQTLMMLADPMMGAPAPMMEAGPPPAGDIVE